MPFDTFTPPIPPSPGTSIAKRPRLYEAEFGDGYTQVTRAGLNHIKRKISLEWEVLLPADADSIDDFLTEKGGDTPFWYTPSNAPAAIKWTCKEWDVRRLENGLRSVSCEFEESFVLES